LYELVGRFENPTIDATAPSMVLGTTFVVSGLIMVQLTTSP
jgi:hypothetical protein